MADVTVSITGLSKSFNGAPALRDVSLDFQAGQIHALMGANGSGKSTLVKLLTGAEAADGGIITTRGKRREGLRSPQHAQLLGFRVVHQETPLVDTMSVAEVIALHLGYPKGLGGRIRWRQLHQDAREYMQAAGLDISPSRVAGSLSASERGILAITIALAAAPNECTLLILDEATAQIPREEARHMLEHVCVLADRGLAVLMVTHRVGEAAEFGDHLAVLDAGAVVYDGPMSKDPEALYELLGQVGPSSRTGPPGHSRPEDGHVAPVPRRRHAGSRQGVTGYQGAFGVEGLTTSRLHGIAFSLQPGEMVGLVGGPGSGIEDIPEALAGLASEVRGRLRIGDETVRLPKTPKEALHRGIALVPRDRLHQGAVGVMSIFENVVLPLSRRWRYWTPENKRIVADVIERFEVEPKRSEYLLSALSGGNQQKVIVGKWLGTQPQLLILDDPTVGVDPWSRERLFEVVRQQCGDGLRVLLLSSEPEQLVEHCSRVLAIHQGLVVEELVGGDISERSVAQWSMA